MRGSALQKNACNFATGSAIEDDYIYVAAKPSVFDSEEEFSRMFFYDAQNKQNPWLHHDLPDWTVVSMCVVSQFDNGKRAYAALSKQGEIEFTWPGGKAIEKIEQAGLLHPSSPIYGYVSSIKEIGGELYVCGSGGQIYRRVNGNWIHIAPELKYPAIAPKAGSQTVDEDVGKHDFSDIAGVSSKQLYVVGGSGEIWHFDGTKWTQCESPSDEILNAAVCRPDGTLWACGFNGSLISGSVKKGFQQLTRFDENMLFTSLTFVNDELFLASDEGLFRYDDRSKTIGKVDSDLDPKLQDVHTVTAANRTLWCIGYQDIVVLTNGKMARLNHPDNT